ncbi:MAG: tRNA (adenosine(37)-N6)-threonylcarbamoyltransferase complex transferase subunit TsaD [Bacteroidales bacterium]|jgi:N6-L-threonylcarbamoyladenine synthase|nr:tRNA (adenosine(37)-N6)-threonylcarbamoyltransferase complex transferase subunit TsaD [Bacteroidales bacterium]
MAYILGIESSCDDTSAAILDNHQIRANLIANQNVHQIYGGVVPELASRAHQQSIVPVVDAALKKAELTVRDLDAIAFTRGPGLLGSLLVGTSFAKAMGLALHIPLIEVNHLEAHILSHFIQETNDSPVPKFPFLCLLVSGGHTQIVLVKSPFDMQIIGRTIDDAAGEAFDKSAKIMGLGYPGGPVIDRLARVGNPHAFSFAEPRIAGYDYSFSGLKTSILYSIRDHLKVDPNFIEHHKTDLCASIQYTIVKILMHKLVLAANDLNIRTIAIAGGVSANSAMRNAIEETGQRLGWKTFVPKFEYTTDNAAMIAMSGYFKFQNQNFCGLDVTPYAR